MRGEEQSDRRRAEILAAASRVFAERGYHRSTVRQVAREAGIADGTIYLYFRSKQDVLLALLGELGRLNDRPADFAELATADARTFADVYLRRRWRDIRSRREVFAAVFPEVLADPALREALRARLALAYAAADAELERRGRSGGLGSSDPVLLARVTSATVLGLMLLDVLGEGVVRERWDELPVFLTSLWFDGLQRR
jgi:TetR/AcrR family fatty acid metabolism transcriptional regulator